MDTDEDKLNENDKEPKEPDKDKPIEHRWQSCTGFCWDCERRTWCWASCTHEQDEFGN